MRALRKLGAVYLAAASAYSVAIMLDRNPEMAKLARLGVYAAGEQAGHAAVAVNDHVVQPGWKLAQAQAHEWAKGVEAWMNRESKNSPEPEHVAANKAKPAPFVKKAGPATVRAENQVASDQQAKANSPVAPTLREAEREMAAPPAAKPSDATNRKPAQKSPQMQPLSPGQLARNTPPAVDARESSPEEIARVTARLRDSLTPEMLKGFELFLYVSKAEQGPWAQRMYVYQKQADGNLLLLHDWPVSTGREQIEFNSAGRRLPSFTPQGYYELDPGRIYAHYTSVQWNQPMPYAMFFNWVKNGYQTGLAIHAATGEDIALLGKRASAGCVRLAPENARVLFNLIRTNYRGLVPKFAYDKRTATMSNDGVLLHDRSGQVELTNGYKVLVFIENYGGQDVVAALY